MSIMDQMRKLMKEVESMEIQALRAEFHRLYGDIPHPVAPRTADRIGDGGALILVVQRIGDFRNIVQVDSGQAVVDVIRIGAAVQHRILRIAPRRRFKLIQARTVGVMQRICAISDTRYACDHKHPRLRASIRHWPYACLNMPVKQKINYSIA